MGGGGNGGAACCATPGGAACSGFNDGTCGVGTVCDGCGCGTGGGTVCGCGTGGGGGAGQLEFVGGNRGSYTTQTQYRYVGNGCGEFDYVKPAPNYCICIVSSSILLLLLGLLLWFLLKDMTNTTTPSVGCLGCLKTCQYVLSNGCSEQMMMSGTGVGPCSKTAITTACMQCASFGNMCAPVLVGDPTPAPQTGPAGTCVVWGDPHILTFDHKR